MKDDNPGHRDFMYLSHRVDDPSAVFKAGVTQDPPGREQSRHTDAYEKTQSIHYPIRDPEREYEVRRPTGKEGNRNFVAYGTSALEKLVHYVLGCVGLNYCRPGFERDVGEFFQFPTLADANIVEQMIKQYRLHGEFVVHREYLLHSPYTLKCIDMRD